MRGELGLPRMLAIARGSSRGICSAHGVVRLAASASFDRLTPALGWTLGIVVVMYVIEVLGTLWPDAVFLQPYSLFYYLKPKAILAGAAEPFDFAVLLGVVGIAVAWAVWTFPRRDLAAPI